MSYVGLLVGSIGLAAAVGSLAFAGRAVARRTVPDWDLASRALVAAGVAVVAGQSVLLALGAVGGFRSGWVLLATVLVSAAIVAVCRSSGRTPTRPGTQTPAADSAESTVAPDPADPADPDGPADGAGGGPSTVVTATAALAVLVCLATWVAQVARTYRLGITDGDSLWYHGPFAVRFVQEGWVTRVHQVNPEPLVAFFPANSEVVQAAFALPFHRDVLAPVVNLAWLGLLLLAGWCAGRARGRTHAALGLTAAAAVAALPMLTFTQAGTERNDIMALALLGSVVALARHPGRRRSVLVLAGALGGLALGVKVSMLVPVALVLLGLAVALVLAGDRRRARTGAVGDVLALLVPVPVTGAYWFVRNWARVGNPLPWVSLHVGPIDWSSPPLPQAAVGASTLVSRVHSPGWWDRIVGPGLTAGYGRAWPLVVAVIAGAALVALVARGPDAVGRCLGAAGVVSLAAYVVTPNSAPVPARDHLADLLFVLNTRYALPGALVVLLVAVTRLPGRRTADLAGVVLLATVAVSAGPMRLRHAAEWSTSGGDRTMGVVAALAMALAAGAVALARRRSTTLEPSRRRAALAPVSAAVGAVVVLVALRPGFDHYLHHRWSQATIYPATPLWNVVGRRAGRVGVVDDFFQLPYVGPRLANRVQYVGVPGPHGAFRDARTCLEWRAALRRDRIERVVIASTLFGGTTGPHFVEWTASIPGARRSFRSGAGVVFDLTRAVGDAGCPS